jgi:iron complex outermembrane receptor protein
LLFTCVSWISLAQSQQSSESPRLNEITVTANPLGNAEGIQAVQVLQGDDLWQERQSTLGETLGHLPGVSSSYFGPNSSRPVIRGMDGDRIKILNNSVESQDVSSLSNDHAVPHDVLSVERIEVLRGPSAIMYGGSAVGGVVNLIDNRIPTAPMDGISGRTEAGWSSGNKERSAAVLLEAGNASVGLHIDAFGRKSEDVSVPDTMACSKSGSASSAKKICNSSNRANGYAIGSSIFWDSGHVGLGVNNYRSDYGTVAEDAVTVGMQSDRYALDAELRPAGLVERIRTQWSSTDYKHTEYEDGSTGTVFKKSGHEFRLSAQHRAWQTPFGLSEGVLGWQSNASDFEADGGEAFMPSTNTKESALYLVEELSPAWGKFSLGLRAEQVNVKGDAFDGYDAANEAATSKRFAPFSASMGSLIYLSPTLKLTGHLARTQRAPKDYELRANGVHVASSAVEVGTLTLSTEKAWQADIGLGWAQGPHTAQLNYFQNRFDNYIGLIATGAEHDDYDVYQFTAARAEFKGIEAVGDWRVIGQNGWLPSEGDAVWRMKWRADVVRATYLDSGLAVPRIPAARLGTTLLRESGPWRTSLGAEYNAKPRRGENQAASSAYTLWNVYMSYRQKIVSSQAIWFARVDNLTDALAYSATSILTTTAQDATSGRPKAPLPGRSFKLGLQFYF